MVASLPHSMSNISKSSCDSYISKGRRVNILISGAAGQDWPQLSPQVFPGGCVVQLVTCSVPLPGAQKALVQHITLKEFSDGLVASVRFTNIQLLCSTT